MVWGLYHSFLVLSNSWGSSPSQKSVELVSRPFRICTRLGIQYPDHLTGLMLKRAGPWAMKKGVRERSKDGVLMVRAIEGNAF